MSFEDIHNATNATEAEVKALLFQAQIDLRAAENQIDILTAQLEECQSGDVPTLDAADGIPIQSAINVLAQGSTLRLVGTFVEDGIRPKSGMTFEFIQGAEIVAPNGSQKDVFTCKGPGAEGVTFKDPIISGAGRHGIGCWLGTHIYGGRIFGCLKDAVGEDLEGNAGCDVLIEGTEIDHNGSEAWLGKGAAGVKLFHLSGFVIRKTNTHHNYGNGLWDDAQCGEGLYEGNTVTFNLRKGIVSEKGGESDGTFGDVRTPYTGVRTIRDNVITDNNQEHKDAANAGISGLASKNMVIEGNTLKRNGAHSMIFRADDKRLTDTPAHGWPTSGIVIGKNEMDGDVIGP